MLAAAHEVAAVAQQGTKVHKDLVHVLDLTAKHLSLAPALAHDLTAKRLVPALAHDEARTHDF